MSHRKDPPRRKQALQPKIMLDQQQCMRVQFLAAGPYVAIGRLAGYLALLRQALIDDNEWHVSVIVCESDYRALKRSIEHLPPGLQ